MTTHARGHRFGMPTRPVSRLFLVPFGVTAEAAYAWVHEQTMRLCFGPMFDEKIALKNIEAAEAARWPRWAGVGPRTNFRGTVALISAYGDAVKLTLKEPIDVHLFVVPMKCRTLYFSVESADAFLKALGRTPIEEAMAKAA